MTFEEIEQYAASNNELPDGFTLNEQLLFFTLRELYNNFRSGVINREQGKREKQRIVVAYRDLELKQRVVDQSLAIRKRLEQNVGLLYDCDCATCRKLIRIFDGVERIDIPQDSRVLHEQNNRLREMVKERSERNAELATTIDKIRWAVEKNDMERVREIVCRETGQET